MNTTEKGARLEQFVEKMLRDMGRLGVKRNVHYTQKGVVTGSEGKAQIDVEYLSLKGRVLVECKYYCGAVGAQEVEEFYERAKKVRHAKMMMITNSRYTQGAMELADSYGIVLVDGDGLERMDYERLSFFGMVKERLGMRKGLEEQLEHTDAEKQYVSRVQHTW